MKRNIPLIGLVAFILVISSSAFASNVLISQQPWGQDKDVANFTDVFGVGNFTTYSSFAAATPGDIFNASNSFVMLEGGAASDTPWANYLSTNETAIMGWVNAGGALLLQSASWSRGPTTFGSGTIGGNENDLSASGTLTPVGIAAFTFESTPVTQSGNYLAHDDITGTGLTDFMLSDASLTPIVAGIAVGNGYIMYSGLTDSEFHNSGNGLVDDVIAYTAGQAGQVPEPTSLLLFGTGFCGLALAAWRKRK